MDLMPIPQNVKLSEGFFELEADFTVAVQGTQDQRIYDAASRALQRLKNRTGFFLDQEFVTPKAEFKSADLQITISRIGQLKLGENESYELKVTDDKIILAAETDLGAMHGLETMLQLLTVNNQKYVFPQIEIKDSPRFQWRGLMMDVCRHWMPIDVVKRNIDAMAAAKLNVLHLHLSEDQGFRVECKTFPKLHQLGSDGNYFTHEQIRDIVKYAGDRGIRVVPEFDIPGHATSWLTAYPEYASAPGPYEIERRWGIFDPTFDPTQEATYIFFEQFFAEIVPLFPDDYFHIGGDENNGKQWDANAKIQKYMKENNIKDNHQLQAVFNSRLLEILSKHDKKMMGWDEIFQPELPNSIVIHSWRGRDSMIKAAQKGYFTVLSNGYYIDLIQPTTDHYFNDPCPSDLPLTKDEQQYILGGEATMWAEFVTPENVDSRIWPRTAAIAERLWSDEAVQDADDMYRRLELFSFQLEELGLLHIKNYEMMLRRLTGNQDISALKTLVNVVEPLKQYQRNRYKDFTQNSPYTRVMDTARPDAQVARIFRKHADQFVLDCSFKAQLEADLKCWQANHEKLLPIIKKSPVLAEIEPLSARLKQAAEIGLECLAAIENNQKMDSRRLKAIEQALQEMQEQVAQVTLMILPGIEKLYEKAQTI